MVATIHTKFLFEKQTLEQGDDKRGHIADKLLLSVFLGEQTGKHLFRPQNVSERNQKQFLSWTQFLCRAGKHSWPQHLPQPIKARNAT